MKKYFSRLMAALLICYAMPVLAQNLYQFSLKNGLKLIVKVDHRAPVAVFQIWYRVGSSYEPNGLTGISHLNEHMMFDGTTKYPEGVLTRLLTINGASFNAFTDRDYTAYYEEMAASKMPLAFKLESDRMSHLTLSQKQFHKEINVVREERRLRTDDQPAQIALERFLAAAYVSSPYHHPVVGWMDDLNHMSAAKVRHWYHSWYAPNNATIVIVGDVQPQAMFKLANQYFGGIHRRNLPNIPATTEVASLGMRSVMVKIPARVPLLLMGYNVPSLKTAKEKWQAYALDVLSGILAAGDSARFARELVRDKQVANSADADYDPFARLNTLFIISGAPVEKDNMTKLKEALAEQITAVQTELVSGSELQRIKAQVIASKVYSRDSIVGQASELGSIVSVGLPISTVDNYTQHINAVTAEQVRAVAREYLTHDNLTETILQPLPMSSADQQRVNSAASMDGSIH